MTQTKKLYWADKLGIISAIACMIHCLAVPTLLSLGIGFLEDPVIAFLFIIIAFISIYKATKGKLFDGLSILLWVAFTGFSLSILLEERAEIFEYGVYIFSIAIVVGHFLNMKFLSKQ
jgi:hypothetical protein